MAVLSKNEFMSAVTDYIGERNDEASVKFFSDVMDTYQAAVTAKGISEEEVNNRVKNVEDKWRQRYLDRFHNGFIGAAETTEETKKVEAEQRAASIGFQDLFKSSK